MNLYNKLLILIGTFIVNIILYNHLIRTRIPKDYFYISLNIKIWCFLMMLLFFCINSIKVYKFYQKTTKSSKIVSFFKELYNKKYNPIFYI